MTDQHDPDAAHLGLEALGDLDEGLLSPAEAESARAHLAGCPQCQDDLAALASVREQLAGEREIAIPDDVSERVFAALAELAPLSESDRPAPEPVSASVTTLPERRQPRPFVKPLLIALTAAAGITLISLGIINLPSSKGSTAASSAAAPAQTTQAAVAVGDSGRAYSSRALGPQALALLPGQASSAAAAGTQAAAAAPAATTAAAPAATTAAAPAATGAAPAPTRAAATSGAALASTAASAAGSRSAAGAATPQPTGLVPANGGVGSTTSAAPAPTTDVLAALRQPGKAQTCLESYVPRSGAPLVIDIGTFDGKPAVIGVFQDSDNSGRLQVVAVGPPGCSLYQLSLVSKP